MQTEGKKRKGMKALEKLQAGGYKRWTLEEIEAYRTPKGHRPLLDITKEILYFMARRNFNYKMIPLSPAIKRKFKLFESTSRLRELERAEMVFSISIGEIVAFYTLKGLGFRKGYFRLPPELEWLRHYLKGMGGRRGSTYSWDEKIKPDKLRKGSRGVHWIALLYDYPVKGKACYEPLKLHIPKADLTPRI